MNRIKVGVLLLVLAAGCSPFLRQSPARTDASETPSEASSTLPARTQTSSTDVPVPTIPALATSVSTTVPCNPSGDYCIEAGHFFLDRPINFPGVDTIDRGYAYGNTENGTRDPHHGVEFYNASGTPVLASADGEVQVAGDDSHLLVGPRLNFYGNVIVLEHHFPGVPKPVYTLYGHLSKVNVRVGQMVMRGNKIGEVGASGEAIGSHLHFEVRMGQDDYNSNQNPVLWLKPLANPFGGTYGAIAGRLEDSIGKPLYTTNLNIQYFLDKSKPQVTAYLVETYATEKQPVGSDERWNENFTLGDIPAGNYRLSLVWGGKLYEDWIVVLPGKLTETIFQIDQ